MYMYAYWERLLVLALLPYVCSTGYGTRQVYSWYQLSMSVCNLLARTVYVRNSYHHFENDVSSMRSTCGGGGGWGWTVGEQQTCTNVIVRASNTAIVLL